MSSLFKERYLFDQGQNLSEAIIKIAIQAGQSISKHYQNSLDVHYKNGDPESPLTQADLDSNAIIESALQCYDLPILSEENYQRESYPNEDDYFWLIDPLDGTRDFIRKNPEFSVCIALMHRFRPIIGVVYAPELKDGCVGNVLIKKAHHFEVHQEDQFTLSPIQALPYEPTQSAKILMSRIEYEKGLKAEFFEYAKQFSSYEVVPCGSAYKFCKIARGLAHFYPRFEAIMLWDIAAGEAIVLSAGGSMRSIDNELILYNRFHDFQAPIIRVASHS
jgi:3'(2'), 5'-bisphosphate nucleotidase